MRTNEIMYPYQEVLPESVCGTRAMAPTRPMLFKAKNAKKCLSPNNKTTFDALHQEKTLKPGSKVNGRRSGWKVNVFVLNMHTRRTPRKKRIEQ